MTSHDDFDRTLARWFEAEAASPAPADSLQRVVRHSPTPAPTGVPRSSWQRLGRGGGLPRQPSPPVRT